jgi:hypothetical protein
MQHCIQILVLKPQGKRPFGGNSHRRLAVIEIGFCTGGIVLKWSG